jgi:hypothetical protein
VNKSERELEVVEPEDRAWRSVLHSEDHRSRCDIASSPPAGTGLAFLIFLLLSPSFMVSLPLAVTAALLLPAFSAADPIHIPITRRSGWPATHSDHWAAAEFMRSRYGYGGGAATSTTATKRMQRRGSEQSLNFVNQVRVLRECA